MFGYEYFKLYFKKVGKKFNLHTWLINVHIVQGGLKNVPTLSEIFYGLTFVQSILDY